LLGKIESRRMKWVWEKFEIHENFYSGTLKGRGHLRDGGLHRKIISGIDIETRCGDLTYYTVQWQASVNTIMIYRFQQNTEKLLTILTTLSFSIKTLVYLLYSEYDFLRCSVYFV
jgi:hypothetical protein